MPVSSMERYRIEDEENWRELMPQIPFIPFKAGWEVAVIPPYAGAVARFLVRETANPKSRVSVYLDWFDKLGCVGKPYWEVYPIDGDVQRCLLNEVDDLVQIISRSLEEQLPNPASME